MRPQSEPIRGLERNALRAQQLAARQLSEFGPPPDECVHYGFVFLAQNAAGCVDQPAAWLHEARCRLQDAPLLVRELGDRLRALPPLEIRVAPQSAESAAWGIHQHPIDLAGEALGPDIVVPRQRDGMNARNSGAHGARAQGSEPLRGY